MRAAMTNNILAFDTCFGTCSVAVLSAGELLAEAVLSIPNRQTEQLIVIIDSCLRQARLTIEEIDYVAVTNGPGSFTGVRIGLACALGFKVAASNIKVITLSTFEAVYNMCKPLIKDIVVAFLCSKNSYYCQKFIDGSSQDMCVVERDAFDAYCGGLLVIGNVEEGNGLLPDARVIALTAQQKILAGELGQGVIEPLYVRQPDAYQSIK